MPGTNWQIPLINKIKELGHKVLVVNPAKDSPAFKYADDYLQSDIFDWEKVYNYAKNNKVDAVMSDECDIAMPMIAKLNSELKLNGMSEETAHLYTDKYLMREFCKKHKLNYPLYKLCKTQEEAIKFFNDTNTKLIIKPLDSNASHGVFIINTVDDIKKHFDETLSFSRIEKSVLLEQYIEGTEFTIDGIKTPNNHYTLAISQKDHFKHNTSIANELFFTHSNPNFDYEKLKQTNDGFVLNTDLQFGFTHAEYKYQNGKFYLIEIAARGGGNMISSTITQFLSGYDTYKYIIDCYLGNVYDQDFSIPETHKQKSAVLKFFNTPNNGGIVKGFKGLDYLENEKDIKAYKMNFSIGDKIENCVSDSARIGFYIACSENQEKLKTIMNNVDDKFSIILE